jgi:hypothetical protein
MMARIVELACAIFMKIRVSPFHLHGSSVTVVRLAISHKRQRMILFPSFGKALITRAARMGHKR